LHFLCFDSLLLVSVRFMFSPMDNANPRKNKKRKECR
jgi:hypothetical protein